jgi:hypothetical protein
MSKSLHQQIVSRAREIIADPGRWIQGQLAVTKDGRSVDPVDAHAYRFCAIGALRRAAHELMKGHEARADDVQAALENFIYVQHPEIDDCLENVNDEEDHATVLRVLNEFDAAQVA